MNVAGKSDVGELVGRSQEFERLLALLEEARSDRGRAALVLGEAGIGKTRLTEAFAAAAANASVRRVLPIPASPRTSAARPRSERASSRSASNRSNS